MTINNGKVSGSRTLVRAQPQMPNDHARAHNQHRHQNRHTDIKQRIITCENIHGGIVRSKRKGNDVGDQVFDKLIVYGRRILGKVGKFISQGNDIAAALTPKRHRGRKRFDPRKNIGRKEHRNKSEQYLTKAPFNGNLRQNGTNQRNAHHHTTTVLY